MKMNKKKEDGDRDDDEDDYSADPSSLFSLVH